VPRDANVEVIRRSFEAFEDFDMERWVADWDEDIEFDVSGYEPWTGERKHYRGVVEILEFFGSMMAGVRVLKVDVATVEAVDDDRVIALYSETRQEPGTDPHDVEVGILYTLRDEKLSYVRVFSDQDAARAAAAAPA
jgi:ketosteroid isomerase-like protein